MSREGTPQSRQQQQEPAGFEASPALQPGASMGLERFWLGNGVPFLRHSRRKADRWGPESLRSIDGIPTYLALAIPPRWKWPTYLELDHAARPD
jgi:hypothetical protein